MITYIRNDMLTHIFKKKTLCPNPRFDALYQSYKFMQIVNEDQHLFQWIALEDLNLVHHLEYI